jgi:hypothetical protein
MALQVGNEFKF